MPYANEYIPEALAELLDRGEPVAVVEPFEPVEAVAAEAVEEGVEYVESDEPYEPQPVQADAIALLFDVAGMRARELGGKPLKLASVTPDIGELSLVFTFTTAEGLAVDVSLHSSDMDDDTLPAFSMLFDTLVQQ
ncbi:MAG TPA: hypothetical protein VGU20_13995 [Stellaceae bacterium]|nr:hypothetical protein [Stellaceae bacterium]